MPFALCGRRSRCSVAGLACERSRAWRNKKTIRLRLGPEDFDAQISQSTCERAKDGRGAFRSDCIATLPLEIYKPGEAVLAAGTKTGRLLILRKGAVVIEKGAR